jgi:hypothetical protein
MSFQVRSSSVASGWSRTSSSMTGSHVAGSDLTTVKTITGLDVAPVAPFATASLSSLTEQESFQKSAPRATVLCIRVSVATVAGTAACAFISASDGGSASAAPWMRS